jgi:hypothetical protein
MFERKPVKEAKRLVWRMSPSNLAGEFVIPADRPVTVPDPEDFDTGGFLASSMDLRTGSDVFEIGMSTLPREVVDAFLRVRR